jgi:Na+/proline symporter
MLDVPDLSSFGQLCLASCLILFVLGLAFLGSRFGKKLASGSDYFVASRSVPLGLSVLALLATWFGSSSVVEASTKMYATGLRGVILDPIACGATLIFTGWLFAERFWRSGCSTVAELLRREFGGVAEWISCAIQVPSFFLWIGAQFLAMGQLLEASLGINEFFGVILAAIATMAVVAWGGMWAVTWANAIMIVVSLLSILVLVGATALRIGDGNMLDGLARVVREAPKGSLDIDFSNWSSGVAIVGVFLTGLFGNVPGQDIQQRVASARTARTARWMCIIAGLLYLLFGFIPMYLGLAARWLFAANLGDEHLPIQEVANAVLSEPLQIVLTIGMFSLCLAVAAGATLGQATLVSESLLKPLTKRAEISVWGGRFSVVVVIVGSALVAISGESIMELLELSLVLVFVSLFVPMCIALFFPHRPSEVASDAGAASPTHTATCAGTCIGTHTGTCIGQSFQRSSFGIATMAAGLVAWLLASLWMQFAGHELVLPPSLIGFFASCLVGILACRSGVRPATSNAS